MPATRSDRFLSRPALIIITAVVVLVGVAVIADRTGWGSLRVATKPAASTTSTAPTTTTAPPPTPEELAAAERFANAGKDPITAEDRGVVDLSGTRDATAPGLGIPVVTCRGAQASVVVTADDNRQVAGVRGTYTRADGSESPVTFSAGSAGWQASLATEAGTADALTVSARDETGNTLTRTVTNLCG
jgi:hypothetical protein